MRKQTMLFSGLLIAMLVVLAYAWFTWPQTENPAAVSNFNRQVPAATSTIEATAASSSVNTSGTASLYPPPSLGEQVSTMQIGGQTLYIDLAQNEAQQALGLGNRAGLGAHQGMLFIFSSDAEHLFWMKDMSFSIDMIWLSDDGTVIYIAPNVAPSTYPDAFGPNQNSRYVLEVPANFASQNGIIIGTKAVLP